MLLIRINSWNVSISILKCNVSNLLLIPQSSSGNLTALDGQTCLNVLISITLCNCWIKLVCLNVCESSVGPWLFMSSSKVVILQVLLHLWLPLWFLSPGRLNNCEHSDNIVRVCVVCACKWRSVLFIPVKRFALCAQVCIYTSLQTVIVLPSWLSSIAFLKHILMLKNGFVFNIAV